jgi:mannose-6-phosphate isomerase-like protein (cupin superfamily)
VQSETALFTAAELEKLRKQKAKSYLEFLRVPSMSAGLYVLAAGTTDLQRPHHQDEMYYVLRGRGRFRAADQDNEICAGSVLFVAAEVEHRFHDITDELSVLVFFAPAEN